MIYDRAEPAHLCYTFCRRWRCLIVRNVCSGGIVTYVLGARHDDDAHELELRWKDPDPDGDLIQTSQVMRHKSHHAKETSITKTKAHVFELMNITHQLQANSEYITTWSHWAHTAHLWYIIQTTPLAGNWRHMCMKHACTSVDRATSNELYINISQLNS